MHCEMGELSVNEKNFISTWRSQENDSKLEQILQKSDLASLHQRTEGEISSESRIDLKLDQSK